MEGGDRMNPEAETIDNRPVEVPKPREQKDRVRSSSPKMMNRRVDQETWECLDAMDGADRESTTCHIGELAHEWDMERYLQTNASVLALAGTVLGAATKNKKWLILPAIVFPFLLEHALQGWCPPMPLFRRMGVRTRKEINREKYALKAMRGDFQELRSGSKDETS
jgi:hypothetical protein